MDQLSLADCIQLSLELAIRTAAVEVPDDLRVIDSASAEDELNSTCLDCS